MIIDQVLIIILSELAELQDFKLKYYILLHYALYLEMKGFPELLFFFIAPH